MRVVWKVLLGLALAGGLVACQTELTDEQIDRIFEERYEEDRLKQETEAFVEALLAHPDYQAYLEFDAAEVEQFTNAMLAHPLYQTTPEEDCAAFILMAVVIGGDDLTPPTDAQVDELCAWYRSQVE